MRVADTPFKQEQDETFVKVMVRELFTSAEPQEHVIAIPELLEELIDEEELLLDNDEELLLLKELLLELLLDELEELRLLLLLLDEDA